jgi:hypothetical protein
MIRLIAMGIALALVASAQAAPLARHSQRDSILTKKGQGSGGCPAYYYRGVGGTCVQGDGSRVYHPDPYWTPCDYSQSPMIPEGCGS